MTQNFRMSRGRLGKTLCTLIWIQWYFIGTMYSWKSTDIGGIKEIVQKHEDITVSSFPVVGKKRHAPQKETKQKQEQENDHRTAYDFYNATNILNTPFLQMDLYYVQDQLDKGGMLFVCQWIRTQSIPVWYHIPGISAPETWSMQNKHSTRLKKCPRDRHMFEEE